MKKTAIAGILAATLAGAVHAQSNVTVYGVLDTGVVSASNSGTANGQFTGVVSGIHGASHIGFRSTEKIDNKLTVGVKIESDINVANGTQGLASGSGSANAVFARGSNVFLQHTDLGTVTIGRQDNAAWSTYSSLDSRRHSNFGGNPVFLSDGSSFGGTATSKTGLSKYTGGPFVSQAIRYDTPTFGGFSATYARMFGNVAGDMDASAADQVVLRYDNKGMVFGAVGYYNTNASTGTSQGRNDYAGVGIRATKDLTLLTNYWKMEDPNGAGAANTKFDLYSVGARYQINPKLEATVGFYRLEDKINSNNGADRQSAGLAYSLSKRTTLMAMASYAQNKGTTGFAAWGGGGSNANTLGNSFGLNAAGIDQKAYAVAIRHSF